MLIGELERQDSLYTMKRGRPADQHVWRNKLLCIAFAVSLSHGDDLPNVDTEDRVWFHEPKSRGICFHVYDLYHHQRLCMQLSLVCAAECGHAHIKELHKTVSTPDKLRP